VPPDATEELHARARAILARLGARPSTEPIEGVDPPAHATRATAPAFARDARAARNALLVLEDGAAGVHNATHARALLDAAEAP
jgi:hypothetical protein